jgi:hypothetical protein
VRPRRTDRADRRQAAAEAPERATADVTRNAEADTDLAECLALLGRLGGAMRDDDEPLPPREPEGELRRDLVDSLASLILADLDRGQGGAS